MSVSVVFHKNLECASRLFHERFQKDPNVSSLCFKGVLGYFCQQGFLLGTEVMVATHPNSIGLKHPKNTLGTPVTYSRITSKHY